MKVSTGQFSIFSPKLGAPVRYHGEVVAALFADLANACGGATQDEARGSYVDQHGRVVLEPVDIITAFTFDNMQAVAVQKLLISHAAYLIANGEHEVAMMLNGKLVLYSGPEIEWAQSVMEGTYPELSKEELMLDIYPYYVAIYEDGGVRSYSLVGNDNNQQYQVRWPHYNQAFVQGLYLTNQKEKEA